MSQAPIPLDLTRYTGTADAESRFGISKPQLAYLCRLGPENGGLNCVKFSPRLWLIEIESLTAYNERIKKLADSGHLRGRKRKINPPK